MRSKLVGLLSIAKYASIACFTLALISTIGLNLYKTYSNSSIETSAIGSSNNGEPAIQADIDPTSSSLSITSSPSSSTGGNNPNLSLSIPQGGGIATGRHTVTVKTGSSVIGYDLMLSSDSEETSLVNSDNVDNEGNDSGSIIPTTTGTIASPVQLADKSYGYTLANLDNDSSLANTNIWAGLKPSANPDTIATVNESNLTIGQANTTSHNIYYGVNIQNLVETRAGDYTAQIVYTVTATLHEPTIASISPTTYELASNEGLDSTNRLPVTITGNYLSSTSRVYLTNSNTTATNAGTEYDCTNIKVASDSKSLTCTLPTDKTNSDLEAGDYNLTILADNGTAVLDNAFTYTKASVCRNADPDSDCQVDIDDNMVPVVYVGYDGNGGGHWAVVSDTDIRNNPGSWYNYRSGQWANAVTVQNPSEYTNAATGAEVDNNDVLGYWVYIPRYAYRVQRRDASNSTVSAQNFDIVFETKDIPKKTPVACSGNYIGCSSSIYPNTTSQDDPLNSQTGWATHPAFTWGTEELNGFWIGKFETTGSTSQPTVLPNQKHMSQISGNIGDMYDVAKSIGVEDKNNVYGNSAQTSYNNGKGYHNLAISTSHMLKNSEWGVVAYLSASRYGAGVNNVQINANASSGNDGNGDSSYGVTGCGPDGSSQYNTENGQLASTTSNIYGVYDMAGGAYEYVMGSYTNDSTQSYPSNDYITNKVKPPYVDLYVNLPFNGNEDTNNNLCTWTTCGGHALFETAGWGDDYSYFVHSSNPWFLRGGYANADSAGTGVFYSGVSNGRTLGSNSFRVGLAALSAM